MKRIFITGASGQLGLALNKLMSGEQNYQILRTDAVGSEDCKVLALDITDEKKVIETITGFSPDIIINCAAMTAVDLCESEQDRAYRINALGPKHLALAAEQCRAKLVHISTDYVYDGSKDTPYVETDDTKPISVYGRTKLEGEEFVLKLCSKAFILRTAWLYGEGKNFVNTMLRLADEGKSIRVVSDQFGTPTSAAELARVIIFLMETIAYGIYNVTNEGSASWYEFAVEIFRLTGRKVSVTAIPTSEYPTPAARPKYSVLDKKALRERHGYVLKEWTAALEEYIDELIQ